MRRAAPKLIRGLIALVFVAPVGVASAQGYGYSRAKDPLIIAVRKAIAQARAGENKKMKETVDSLSWQVEELKTDIRVDMSGTLKSAVSKGDATSVGYALTHLVFQAMRQKFHWNIEEKLAKHAAARSRLDAAEFYYEEILSHAVRRFDKKKKRQLHRDILQKFREARSSLGGPGLFGVGARAPELDRFRELSNEIVAALVEVYPSFRVKPDPAPGGPPDKDQSS